MSITVEEMRRIREAALRVDGATGEWAMALRRDAPRESIDAANARWLSAREDFDEALAAVTDWSTAPEPVGKDA